MSVRIHQRGFSLVEVLVALAVGALTLASLTSILALSLRAFRAQAEAREALLVAEEGAEVLRFGRDADWSGKILPLTPGTVYYMAPSGQSWTFPSTDPGPILGRYTRSFVLARVYRDTNGNIAPTGTEDTGARSFTVTVSWIGTFGAHTAVLEGYVMNILGDS